MSGPLDRQDLIDGLREVIRRAQLLGPLVAYVIG